MIQLKDIRVQYGDFIAIDHVNLEIADGEFFTLLGPSGCGKTTTLRCMAGFNQPTQGKVMIDGKDVTYAPVEKRKLGMVFQSYALFPTMTVEDNISFGLKVDRWPKEQIQQRVDALSQLVNLNAEQRQKNVSQMSGGQQQRVAIARALAKRPKTVLFDEPLSNLDAKLRKSLRLELKRIQRETGMTAVYVTHDQEEALVLSDHVAVFNNGSVEQVGTPEEIYNHSATEFVCNFIGDANFLHPEMIEELNAAGAHLDPAARNYIRQEKVRTRPAVGAASITAQVVSKAFYGTYSTYVFEKNGHQIVGLEKEDGASGFEIGDNVTLYLREADVLSYKGGEK